MTKRSTWMLGLAALGVASSGCTEEPSEADAPRADLILEVDGLRFWKHELASLLRYVQATNPRQGEASSVAGILEHHLIPLKLAQRSWPEKRAEVQERADALRRVVGNGGFPALVATGRQVAGDPPAEPTRRGSLPLVVDAWAFDESKIGQVSPVLETPAGFSVVSTYGITPGITTLADRAESFHVAFATHDPDELRIALKQAIDGLSGKVTYVHDDYRHSLPPWLKQQ